MLQLWNHAAKACEAASRILADLGANRWYALVYGLYGAQLLALRADLNEALAQLEAARVQWEPGRRQLAPSPRRWLCR